MVEHVRVVGVIFLVGVLVNPVAGTALAITDDSPDSDPQIIGLVGPEPGPETDNTVTRIVLHKNGSATWTLQIRTRLETNESEEEYRAFQDRFRENTSDYLDPFQTSITGIVANANNVTGREMSASAFSASTSIQFIPRRWGVVTFEFRWDEFAAAEGDTLVVGDVFQGGLFIAEGDSLVIVAPEGYQVESVNPAPDDSVENTVAWTGRQDFADQRPRVVVLPSDMSSGLPASPLWLLGVAVLLVMVLGGVGFWWTRRNDQGLAEVSGGGDSRMADQAVLADEDYVIRALSSAGGRMRQSAIAEELDWSRSKTSRVLGRMEEDGEIEKLQLGRENIIALPDAPEK